jgi:hypothetical protein
MKVQPADVFRHADNIVTRKVMDETLLVPISGQLASMDNLYTLNETGAFIWQALDGSRSLAEISVMLEEQYDAPAEVIKADMLEIADGLVKAGLIALSVNS